MTNEQIFKHLDGEFEKFLELFEGELREIISKNVYFAGGCIYCLTNDKPVKDYDMFMPTNEHFEDIEKAVKWGFKSEYALTYGKYQLITKYYGMPHRCVGQFDFKHNMFVYRPHTKKIKVICDNIGYLKSNILFLNEDRCRDTENIIKRIPKFVKRGMLPESNLYEKLYNKIKNQGKLKEDVDFDGFFSDSGPSSRGSNTVDNATNSTEDS